MSNLDELIERLCPDGVEYKEINDCTIKVQNIKWKSYVGEDKQYIDLSSVDRERNIITETQNINPDTAPSRAQQIVMKDDIILGTTRPMLKRYCIIPEKYDGEICSTGFCVLRAKTDIINPRWLYHNITTKKFFAYVEKNQQGASYPAISDTIVKAFKLPVPPLEVQREIVRILDNFAIATTEIQQKLQEELAARQKQYEYYRDLLLTFKSNESTILNERTNELELSGAIRWMKLGDIAKFTYGYTDKAKDFGNARFIRITDITEDGCLNSQGAKYINLTADSKKYLLNYGDLLLARTGATYGKTLYFSSDIPAVYASFLIKITLDNNIISNRFYWHFSKSRLYWEQAEKLVSQGGQQQFNTNAVSRVNIPVPPLEVQQRIVDILDRFDTLCNDISSGLPAEIEMRQKQYEYYRDKLLTFKELKKEA